MMSPQENRFGTPEGTVWPQLQVRARVVNGVVRLAREDGPWEVRAPGKATPDPRDSAR